MKIGYASLWLGILIGAQFAWASDTAAVNQARLWFEWGEYQKIISEVPVDLAKRQCDSMSADCARLHLYLGVALFASGQLRESRKEFVAAFGNDPDLQMDEKYVSPEMNDFYLAAKYDYTKELSEKRIRDSLLYIQRVESERKRTDELQARARAQRTGLRRSVEAGIGCVVLTAIAAGVTSIEYRQAQTSYDRFRTAAGIGDLSAYNRYKRLTIRADAFSIVAGIIAVVGAGGGVYSFYQTLKRARHSRGPALH
jgi:hypothetical protein